MSPVTNPIPADESALILRSQDGDRAAFAELIQRYWDRLYRWLCRQTRDSQAAEDLTQETFLRAFANLNRFTAGSNFRAWLFCIAHNAFVNVRRTLKKNRVAMPADLADDRTCPMTEAISNEEVEKVGEAIARLPSDFRGPLLLRIEENLSFKEIADVMGITEETARWRVYKARQKVMALLSEEVVPGEP